MTETTKMTFAEKLRAAQQRANSWLCVGLDTDRDSLCPSLQSRERGVVEFNRAIVEKTRDLVCAFKPNLAFYLARGSAGLDDLAETVAAVPRDIPVLLDAKFGDIQSSARGYARYAFETLGVDAVTLNPYLGADAIAPFLEYQGRAVFLLAHTSNPSSSELQDISVAGEGLEPVLEPLYVHVAHAALRLAGKAQVALVVGATFPDQLRELREACPGLIFLVPGIGSQGGSLREAVEFGRTSDGIGPILNASRSILYASRGDDYADAARAAAIAMRDQIRVEITAQTKA